MMKNVGAQNNGKKSLLEAGSIIMQNLSDILPLFCKPTWLSHHVSQNQEDFWRHNVDTDVSDCKTTTLTGLP